MKKFTMLGILGAIIYLATIVVGTFESLWIIIFLQWLVVISFYCRNNKLEEK